MSCTLPKFRRHKVDPRAGELVLLEILRMALITVGKRNYFKGYGILVHELPVVAVLFIQSNNNEGRMKNSILGDIL